MSGVEVICKRCLSVVLVLFGTVVHPFICTSCKAPKKAAT